MIELRASPEFRTKQLEGIRKVLDDPEFQARRIQGVKKKWSDPEFRSKKVAEARLVITKLNQDTDQLDKAAKGIRILRSDPESSKLFVLPTIQGFRKDIGYYALSAWEANFARVIKFTGRQFYPKESFSLSVSEPYTKLFHFDTTQYTVDYVVEDPRGNLIVYDLIAHPIEDPVGLAKADMFKHQYPDIPLHIISERLYRRIRKKYERIINNSDDFCGWETSKDNLYNNPAKYT